MLPSTEELKSRYASWSNRKLLAVIHYKKQYTSEAVEIARQELGQRNITTDDVDAFLQEQEQKMRRDKMLSSVSLKFWEKVRCFFLWFLPSLSPKRGFTLKEQQSQTFSIAGFISLFVDAFIIYHFKKPVIAGVAILILFFLIFSWYEKQGRRKMAS